MKTQKTSLYSSLYCFYGLIFAFVFNCVSPLYGQLSRPGMQKPDEELPVSRSTPFLSNDWIYWESQKPVDYYVINQTPLKNLTG